jgi:hypothetical protein
MNSRAALSNKELLLVRVARAESFGNSTVRQRAGCGSRIPSR